MNEYIHHSDSFQKRLGTEKVSPREERYLLFRMAGPLMQGKLHRLMDLTKVPVTFLHGNPHLDNYVKTMRGAAMIDFDRSRMGPYCWDIIRFLSSLSLRRASQDGFLDRKVVEHFIDAYIVHFLHPEIPAKQLRILKSVGPEKWQMTSRDYLNSNRRWAKKMRDHRLSPSDPQVIGLLHGFLASRNETDLLNDFAIEEVGMTPGSFGKLHYIYALLPKNSDSRLDAIILDIKEVYQEKNTRFFYSPFDHHGLRMIEASKIFADGMEERLGYCTHQGKQFWGRQVPSFAVKVKKFLDKEEQCDFAYSVGSELGKGHRKGIKEPKIAEQLEKDFVQNFDKYLKVSKLLTFELKLAYEAIKRRNKLYHDFRSW